MFFLCGVSGIQGSGLGSVVLQGLRVWGLSSFCGFGARVVLWFRGVEFGVGVKK